MQKQSKLLILLVALVALIGTGVSVSNAAPLHDRVIAAGTVVTEDLNLQDDLDLEPGGVINANVSIFGGDANIAGTVSGNLLVFGGDIQLAEGASITGECVVIAGTVTVNNSTSSCTQLGNELEVPLPNLAAFDSTPLDIGPVSSQQPTFIGALMTSLFLGLIAFGTSAAAPRHVERICDAITVKPVASGTVGVLTFVAMVSAITIIGVLSALLTIVCVGVLGVPIVLALSALLIGGGLIGWVSIGKLVGEVLRDALHMHQISVPATAALGTIALSLAIGMIGLLPAIGFGANIAIFLIGGIGLGATALTRFGTRTWPLFAINIIKEQTVVDSLVDDINIL